MLILCSISTYIATVAFAVIVCIIFSDNKWFVATAESVVTIVRLAKFDSGLPTRVAFVCQAPIVAYVVLHQ